MADDCEQRIFAAAELLSDGELIDFMKHYHEYRTKATGISDLNAEYYMCGKSVIVRWCEEKTDNSHGTTQIDIGPLDWDAALGRWAAKLKHTGLLTENVRQRSNHESVTYGGAMLVRTSVITTITFESACAQLYELLSRSLGPESQS
jgi:hypothetical protein